MCGFAGLIDPGQRHEAERLLAAVTRMADTLHHRGPDDSGAWADAASGIALGFRRLAILDLTEAGHQPMHSADGRYVITFNGEVYNFAEVRRELEPRGHRFRGGSDTEVALAAFCEWGVEAAVRRFNGMFAIALWDTRDRRLHLLRDRLGKKPLYYGWQGGVFLFGSELKALRTHPAFRAPVNRAALQQYLRHTYVPSPHSIYEGISKLPPAGMVTVDPERRQVSSPSLYWSFADAARQGLAAPMEGTEEEVTDRLERLLRDAVDLRMTADVPLGAFLSGGTDSSLIVALMQSLSRRPVKTFTIGFREEAYNEAEHARAVAEHLGTEHTELYVTPEEARAVIPRLPALYDEPFADVSQIPTYLVATLARRDVTVSLSGDGGDELFGGYGRYLRAERLWREFSRVPRVVRGAAASVLRAVAAVPLPAALTSGGPGAARTSLPHRLNALAEVLPAGDADSLYLAMTSHWKDPGAVVLDGAGEPGPAGMDGRDFADFTHRMMFRDTLTYLPDDILVKVDRATMGVSLEARAPLLDYRVAEFAWAVPLSMKVRGGTGKWLLRHLLSRYVPRSITDRPKSGFDVPVGAWLRGPLREWSEALLNPRRIEADGYLRAAPIRQKWREHLSGARNWQHLLWSVLMFHTWLDS